MKLPQHGSNPQYLYKEMGMEKPDQIIDLSANINPLGPPECIKENWINFFQKVNDYPDPYTLSLKTVISEKNQVSMDSILIGNGGAELISLVGRLLSGKNVLIIEPGFSEYEKACQANDCQIYYHYLKEPHWELHINEIKERLKKIDAVFLCNPSNPTGVFYRYDIIVQLLEECKKANTLLIVDEAFYDFVEGYTSIAALIYDYKNLVILRSMTKMFAIPGLRLGYVIAHQSIVEKIAIYQPHWSVNALAMAAGELCLQDESFVYNTIQYIKKERTKLFAFFEKEGFTFSPSKVNFYLLKEPQKDNTEVLFTFLLKHGIVPRHTFNFPGLDGKWLRFAIKSAKENNQLMEVLKEWRQLP
ncbi:threonine-phosphate decarboxylase CobD [Oceanobacillus sp. Castelsardo]|uniref:threonine-phosphate decarboxylase CobD n=1 Tax=Oceanobacillus sp. Castelsardo TaxID=1851204 RepID=UPI0009ED3D5D|nr:threonine-phosphate decarboxylase CobD [Oceanobacillus sp. Castelsardo]